MMATVGYITRAVGWGGPSIFWGPNGTYLARGHFRAQKSLDFKGPPLPMALKMDVAYIKIISSRPI
jgi:hypothetical protein